MPFGLGFFATAGAGAGAAGSFDLLETQVLDSSVSSITFSSLSTYASTYKHLQVRVATKKTALSWVGMYLNGTVGGSNDHYRHELAGNGSSVSSGGGAYPWILVGVHGTDAGSMVIDVLDAFSSNKRKTVRTLSGYTGSGGSFVQLTSGVKISETSALSSFQLGCDSGSFSIGSRFSLYGIRAV